MSPTGQLTCRHLEPGDVLLKLNAGSKVNVIIEAAGKNRPNFCSQFVVAVYQFAAEQNGKAAATVFDAVDAVPPSRLLSMLRRTQAFRQVGYLASHAR